MKPFHIKAHTQISGQLDKNETLAFNDIQEFLKWLDKVEKQKKISYMQIIGNLGEREISHYYSLSLADYYRAVYSHDRKLPAWSREEFKTLLRSL